MRASLILTLALLLSAGVAWAQAPPSADVRPVSQEVTLDDPLFEGGGCVVPDLSGLSDEEAATALLEAGFDTSSVATAAPACPVTFSCSSIANCGIGGLCSITDIGPCCTTSGGLGLCCTQGTIKVRRCPCTCTGNPCNVLCPQSTDVRWRCA